MYTKILIYKQKYKIKITNSYSNNLKVYYNKNSSCITYDNFLNAITQKQYCEAEKYLSRTLRKDIDIKSLDDIFENERNYNKVVKVEFNKKNKKDSMLIINKNKNNDILHLYLTYEPDENSMWKIYDITKE